MSELRVRESAVAWELRSLWARAHRVVLVIEAGPGRDPRVHGTVVYVAPTDAFALLRDGAGDVHVPLALVAAVRRPHFHEPLHQSERVPVELPEHTQMTLEDFL